MSELLDAIESGDFEKTISILDADPSATDADLPDGDGDTPIHIAAWQNQPKIVKSLIERGANLNRHGCNDMTPLHYAARHGSPESAELLLQHWADPELTDESEFTPLFTAVRGRHQECLEVADLLIQYGANYDLHSAVCLGDLDRVRELLEQNPNLVREARFGKDLVYDASVAESLEIIELLVSHGADINGCGLSGNCALIYSVQDEQWVRFLLDLGADPNVRDCIGRTALDHAKEFGTKKTMRLLKERGAKHGNPGLWK